MHGGTGVTGLVLGAAAAIVRDGTESDKVVIIAAKKSHNKHSQSSLMTLSSRLRRTGRRDHGASVSAGSGQRQLWSP